LAGAAVALLMTLVLLVFGGTGMLAGIEGALLDLRFRERPLAAPAVPLTVIAVDDASIAELGRWPWSRALYARLLDRIGAGHPAVIGFDLLFTEPSANPADDAAFAAALERNGPAIVPFAIGLQPSGPEADLGDPPSWLSRVALPRVRGSLPDRLPSAASLLVPLPSLAEQASLAHVTVAADAAGQFHFDYPVLRVDELYVPSLSLEAVRTFLRVTRSQTVVAIGQGIELGPRFVPTDAGLRLPINYYSQGSLDQVSFADALAGRVPARHFTGRIVLIGVTAGGLGDLIATPYGAEFPGVLRQATVMANLLARDTLRHDDTTLALDIVLILTSGLILGFAARRGLALAFAVAGVLLVALAASNYIAFARTDLWLNGLFPVATVVATLAVLVVWRLATKHAEIGALHELAHRDPLTGLANRAGLHDWVGRRVAGAEPGRSRLLVFVGDLDGFKAVNDTLGHPAGDALLQQVAARLTETMRHEDLVARLGGDEFVIVMPYRGDGGAEAGIAAMHRAFARVAEPYRLGDVPARVGMSLGGACWPLDDADPWRVLALADAALYEAKRQGKGRVVLHRPGGIFATEALRASG
jgi:adenylate cyclase